MKKKINIAVVGLGQIGIYLLNELIIKKRNEQGIWKNLYEFPLIETDQECLPDQVIDKIDVNLLELRRVKKIKHRLSHQLLHISFFIFKAEKITDDFIYIKSLPNYPFPKPINKFISELI